MIKGPEGETATCSQDKLSLLSKALSSCPEIAGVEERSWIMKLGQGRGGDVAEGEWRFWFGGILGLLCWW